MPNFRSFETQARWSVYTAAVGAAALAVMFYIVFKGFDPSTRTIPFDANGSTMGRLRPQMVMMLTPVVAVFGIVSFGMGYSSLGEKKNSLQGRSWAGMGLGATLITLSVLLFMTWRYLAVQVIR